MTYKIVFYRTNRNKPVIEEFIESLDRKTHSKVINTLDVLAIQGPFLKPPYMKKLLPGLYELRIKSRVAIRLFYSPKDRIYYVLHAFIKKTQKTPQKELKIAIDRMKEII